MELTSPKLTQKYFLHRIDWTVTLFIIATNLLAATLVPWYLYHFGISTSLLLFALLFAMATNLSITSGYHRFFAHKSYDAHPILRGLYLLIGAAAFQGSALKWAADHRTHHKYEDTEKDPYSINKGFWYAHIGWLFLNDSTDKISKAPDLEQDWMVAFQHKYYVQVAIFMGFVFPALVGWGLGSFVGGLLIAGLLRIVVTQQSTFAINSFTHSFGKQPYSLDCTARDSFWVAVFTHGEGYHNFHHKFPYDYRNAIKWHQWDPTRWMISALSWIGLTKNRKTVPQKIILRAKLNVEKQRLLAKGYACAHIDHWHEKLLVTIGKLEQAKKNYQQMKSELHIKANYAKSRDQLLLEMKLLKIEYSMSFKMWRTCLKYNNRQITAH